MAGLLSDIYSAGDTLKRRLRGLLADPAGTIGLGVERFGEDQQGLLNLMSNAHPMAGDKTVLNSPKQVSQFRGQLADKGTEQAMAGMFVGQGSKTWDAISAKKAEQMAAQGVDPRKVWSETGTWKGPDGAWRQEIPDNAADVPRYSKQSMRPFDEAMLHEPLEEAYPSVKNIIIETSPGGALSGAEYRPNVKFHKYGDRESIVLRNSEESAKQNKSLAMHELQHAIQQREGFARGGSPEMFNQQEDALTARDALAWARELQAKKKMMPDADVSAIDMAARKDYEALGFPEGIPRIEARQLAQQPAVLFPDKYPMQTDVKDMTDLVNLYGLDKRTEPFKSHDLYSRLAGEAEARATQARIPLDATQRRALFPEDSYDVPMDQLIIRGLLGN